MLGRDNLLWEVRVLQGPEAQHALLEGLGAVDVILSVTDGDQVWVCHVDVDARNLASLALLEGELEQVLQRCLILRI